MTLTLIKETHEEIRVFSGDGYFYPDILEVEYVEVGEDAKEAINLELKPIVNPHIQKYKDGGYEDDSIYFMLTKRQAKVLGQFLISISK